MQSGTKAFIIALAVLAGIYIVGVIINWLLTLILIRGIVFEITKNEIIANYTGWILFIVVGFWGTVMFVYIIIFVVAVIED